jgi:hypothetical protein
MDSQKETSNQLTMTAESGAAYDTPRSGAKTGEYRNIGFFRIKLPGLPGDRSHSRKTVTAACRALTLNTIRPFPNFWGMRAFEEGL